jgi:hypothetical protein
VVAARGAAFLADHEEHDGVISHAHAGEGLEGRGECGTQLAKQDDLRCSQPRSDLRSWRTTPTVLTMVGQTT